MHQKFIDVFYCNEVLSHELWSSKYENWEKSLWRGGRGLTGPKKKFVGVGEQMDG